MLYIYVAVGMKMAKYTSLDEKVDLLVERMSECLRLVNVYMDSRKIAGEYVQADRIVFGEMRRDFPGHIEELSRIQERLKTALVTWGLKSMRAVALRKACADICHFHQNAWRNTSGEALSHVRNEMENLLRFKQNLYPREWELGWLTSLNTLQGPLIKYLNEDTQHVVVVSELAWEKRCAVCFVREPEVVLYPCTHWCLCRECRDSVPLCPLCRSRITTHRAIGDVRREGLPFIQSAPFEGYTSRLLKELQALGSGEN